MEIARHQLDKVLLNFLEDLKKEIEADGLIATLDEAIERVKKEVEY